MTGKTEPPQKPDTPDRLPGPPAPKRGDGLIGLFSRHPTAANLLMVVMIVVGVFSLNRMNTQFFPDFGIDIILISIEWPGASAEDVDSNVVQAVEREVRFVDGVKRVRSTSSEGFASVVIEFDPGADMQAALADIESAVGQITTLPEDSERPKIKRIVRYDPISRILISGPYPEKSLKALAKRMRDDLLNRGIDKIDIFGGREEEIWVEVDPEMLRRLDMTLGDIAARIGQQSRDLPSGTTRGAAQRQIRSLGLVKDAKGVGEIEIRALENGQRVLLRDVSKVSEAFKEGQVTNRYRGERAIVLQVQRSTSADALELADTVKAYLAELGPTLPGNLTLKQYDINADLIRSRIKLLLTNGAGGLVLVLLVLFLFLNARVAFWVAVGIPVSLLGAMLIMLLSGQTINMISLFGLIMALGIIVDDAIVVGEHSEFLSRRGADPTTAAVKGARRMAAPVFSSSLTTIAAFLPLFVISDIIGQIIRGIPLVITAVILASLVECFLVMPGHMKGALAATGKTPSRFRQRFDAGFSRFRDGAFQRTVTFCVRNRYATLAAAIAAFLLCVGIVAGGRVSFYFFPSAEVDKIYANVEMAAGTPRDQTIAMIDELERALTATDKKLSGRDGGLVRVGVARIGRTVGAQPGLPTEAGDHVAGMVVELVPSESRSILAADFMDAWRKEVRLLAGTAKLTILPARGGPPGQDVDVRLNGSDPRDLKAASVEIIKLLERYPGVKNIADNLPYGKGETILELTPHGKALGFTTETVGRQMRDAFQGAIAKRFPRGDEEVLVRVQFPRERVGSGLLDTLYLRSPKGAEVPLGAITRTTEKKGFAKINREDGSRQVAITAEINKEFTNTGKVLAALRQDGIRDIADRYGLTFSFKGKAEEQATTFGDMKTGAMIGLIGIYIILAWVFASYTRPIVVMAIIPLGFVGAVLGHLLLGFDLTILSMVALIGLSGIVVNDSIILVSTIDEHIAKGQDIFQAVIEGARDRLRAVLLTSLTTIGGLLPLLFEKDLQAQFLIPMALTIVFGLAVATLWVLLLVPSLIAIQGDVGRLLHRLRQRQTGEPDEPGLGAGHGDGQRGRTLPAE